MINITSKNLLHTQIPFFEFSLIQIDSICHNEDTFIFKRSFLGGCNERLLTCSNFLIMALRK